MNSFIETLNQWGGNFLNFAWPMLWQSSLLIALVLALDFLLARKIRAAVRYALWLAVLVKLLLPPALALPTGAAWWLMPAPPVAKAPPAKHFTVTYDDAPAQPYIAPPTVAMPAPPVRLELAGWALLVSVVVSAALLAWLALRWWQVARLVRAATAAEEFSEALGDALRLAGVRVARLKIIESQMSPAVCGLLRPVILLPRELAEKLSPAQLRAVLLHEIFHLRRKDVWVNCAQALLQIFYWWHPLLWVANARIRRVREEAVDDAVMLALRDDAETYAPTLLEVAKLAFRRPLMSLGLVGIMESRSALRQRIERLVDFRAPRKAGLTFASLCGIFIFSAVALPMGEAPAEKKTAPVVGIVAAEPAQASTNSPQVLIQAEFYRMQFADFQRVASDAKAGAAKPGGIENFKQFVQGLKAAGFKPFSRPRVVTNNGVHAQFYVGNETNSVELDCQPFVTNGLIEVVRNVRVIWSSGGGLVTNEMNDRVSVENHGGKVFCFTQDAATGSNVVAMTFSVEIITNKSQFQQRLQSIIRRADDTNSIAGGNGTNLLFTRVYNADTTRTSFIASLKQAGAELDDKTNAPAQLSAAVRKFFAGLGVNWESPAGKAVFFNDRNGLLFIKSTKADLDTVDKVLQMLNAVVPQIHIKTRFVEVPKGTVADFNRLLNASNAAAESFSGVLNPADARKVYHSLTAQKNSEIWGEPEVTTLSGRQCQMRATQVVTVVTNFAYQESITNNAGAVVPQMGTFETGPIVDLVPHVLADGYTINLTVTTSLTEFLGYASPPDVSNVVKNENRVQLPVVLPRFNQRQVSANLNLWDNQTAVLGGMSIKNIIKDKTPVLGSVPLMGRMFQSEHTNETEILVFVTATIVDPVGNRVHTDDELSFAQKGVPPQPK